nr:MAG TPA: hypothetical protein [Caudoviricetes sp.]
MFNLLYYQIPSILVIIIIKELTFKTSTLCSTKK